MLQAESESIAITASGRLPDLDVYQNVLGYIDERGKGGGDRTGGVDMQMAG